MDQMTATMSEHSDSRSIEEIGSTSEALPGILNAQVRHYARRALARVAEQVGPSVPLTCEELFEQHHQTKSQVGKRWSEEHNALKKVVSLPRLPPDIVCRSRAGLATIDDALTVFERTDSSDEAMRVMGACTRLSKLLELRGVSFGSLLATEKIIEPVLAAVSRLELGLSSAGWSNFKSRIRRVVRLVDVNARARLSKEQLDRQWQEVLERAEAHPTVGGAIAKIWPLVAHCHRFSISPSDVTNTVIQDLREELERRQRVGADAIVQAVVYGFERLARTVPGWPVAELDRIYRAPGRKGRIRFGELPDSLQEEWLTFARKFGRHGGTGSNSGQSLSLLVVDDLSANPIETVGWYDQSTLINLRSTLVSLGQAAIDLGMPANCLLEVVDAAVVLQATKALSARQKTRALENDEAEPPEKNAGLRNVVAGALSIARRIAAPDVTIEKLKRLLAMVDPRVIGLRGNGLPKYRDAEMGPRHRKRLRQFNDPVKMLAWMQLPYRLSAQMEKIATCGAVPNLEQIGDASVCVSYWITLCCPIRRGNLAKLTVCGPSPNIWLPPGGRGRGRVSIAAEHVKNEQSIHIELDEFAVRALWMWLTTFRPALMMAVGAEPDNPYLFPAAGRKHRAGELLNARFKSRNANAGFELNIHCQRHMCAKVVLDRDCTQIELVRQLLAHKDIETTKRFYSDINQIFAQRKFHEILERQRFQLLGGRRNDRR